MQEKEKNNSQEYKGLYNIEAEQIILGKIISNNDYYVKVSEYLVKDGDHYTVVKDFTADIYIKLKYENDLVYIDLISQE